MHRCLPSFMPDWSIIGSTPINAFICSGLLNLAMSPSSAINLEQVRLPIPGIDLIIVKYGVCLASSVRLQIMLFCISSNNFNCFIVSSKNKVI